MNALFLFLSFSFLAWAEDDDEQRGNIYPQPSFQRVLYADDPYASGYCVDTGKEAEIQGTNRGSDGYMVYQSCLHGRIDNWFDGFGQAIYVGNTKYAAWADLGTPASLSVRYNIIGMGYGSIFESIHWEGEFPFPGLVIQTNSSDHSFVALTNSDTQNLSAIGSVSNLIYPISDHIYIVRICSTQTCSWAQTELYYKFIALNNASPFAVRWNLFYANFEYTDQSEDDEISSAQNTARIALGFGVTTFCMVVIALIYAIWQRHKAHQIAVESPNVNTMATAYQAI